MEIVKAKIKVAVQPKVNAKLNGTTSRGIKGVTIDENGRLIFVLTDNTLLDIGDVTGEPGGHYTPVFEQVDEEHVRVRFVPSVETLPEVEETILELPQGPKGDGYILTDAEKTEIAEEAAELIEVGEFRETDPSVPSWAKQPQKPPYSAEEVGAEPAGTAEAKVSEHNTESKAHNDIRLLIATLAARVNGIFDSEDVDLDQVSEIVAFIKSNRNLIEKVTTDKVNITDIIDDLTTSAANKPLSAKQGVQLKLLIDVLTTAFNNHGADTVSHVTSEEKQAWNNKSNFSGAYKDLTGKPNIPSKPEDIGAQPEGSYLTAETDPTVPSWAKQPTKPSYTASEVGALPSTTKIPSKPEDIGAASATAVQQLSEEIVDLKALLVDGNEVEY